MPASSVASPVPDTTAQASVAVQNAYAGCTNPQTQPDDFITGLVQFPDGRTITAAEFSESPTNNVAARMQQYAAPYAS